METILKVLTRWMVVLALMLACWPFVRHSRADEQPVFKKTLYTARFEWKGASYRFALGTVARAASEASRSRFVALISRDDRSVAVCERQMAGESPFDSNSMLLRCEGELFGKASATAKFRFAPSLERPQLTLWTGARAIPQYLALSADLGQTQVTAAK